MPFFYEVVRIDGINLFKFKFEGNLCETDFNEFKKTFDKCFDDNMGVLFNLSKITNLPMTMIKTLVQYMKEFEMRAKEKMIASCIITSGSKVDGIFLNSLFMIKKPIAPNYVTSKEDDGIEFIQDHASLRKIQQRKRAILVK